MRQLNLIRIGGWPAVSGLAMLAALTVALLPGHSAAVAIALAVGGLGVAGALAVPDAVRLVWRRPSLLVVVALLGLLITWIVVGLGDAAGLSHPQFIGFYGGVLHDGARNPAGGLMRFVEQRSWPWRVGRLPIWALALAPLCAAGGFVLIADAVRVQVGLARPPRSVWRSLTATPSRGGRIAVRAVPGVGLIILAAFLGISLVDRYAEYHPAEQTLGMLGVATISALLVASPVAVGLTLRLDFDKEARARERERQRFAAHLHDSVLQTLALIQRQAGDAESVVRLARRQEHALRAWMAGEADLGSATVAGAVREMVAEFEDDDGLKIELTAIGDAKLDDRSDELIAAAKETLRNVVRHAPGVPVNVFLDVGASGTELFIRDSGPGFAFEEVPSERRGLRDAVIGRMHFAGGSATVESGCGEGTEVTLRLPAGGKRR